MLLSAVNTFLYFEQLRLVEEHVRRHTQQRTQMFARIDFIVQTLTVVSQLLLTGRIASRLGVTCAAHDRAAAVMVLGFLVLASSGTFTCSPSRHGHRARWGEYAFIRPGREMLWSSLDTETKYKAKNFIDVPVYRGADELGAQANTAIDAAAASPAVTALIGAGVAVLWAINGIILGRSRRGTEGKEASATAEPAHARS